LQVLESALSDPATSAKQDVIKGVLDLLATEATLDDVKTAAEALAALIDSGALKTTLSGSNVLLTTHQSAATANGNGTAATVTGYSAIRFRVSGTFSATVNFEASMDGSAWDPLPVVNVATGERITSTTA